MFEISCTSHPTKQNNKDEDNERKSWRSKKNETKVLFYLYLFVYLASVFSFK